MSSLKFQKNNVVLDKQQEVKNIPFSLSMCVYGKDDALFFDRSLESVVVEQSVKPSEIVLVVGKRSSELYRVDDNTQRVVVLSMK